MVKIHVKNEVADAIHRIVPAARPIDDVLRGLKRAWLVCLVALALVGLLMLASGCGPIKINPPTPPTPIPTPKDPLAGVPWCHEAGQTCSLPGKPCKHNPSPDPGHAELAPACISPDPLPGGGGSIDGAPGPAISDHKAQLREAVTAAIRRARPDCDPGGTCLLGEMTRSQWHRIVIDQLRAAGLYAGEHIPGVTDEIAVATSSTSPREGWDIFSGDDSDGPVPPGKPRRTVEWKYTGAYAAPGPPSPPGPAPAGACPAPQPPRAWTAETLPPGWGEDMIGKPSWMLRCKPHVPADVIDCSHVVGPRQCNYCQSIGMGELAPGLPRCECPTRPDDDPNRPACELYIAEGPLVLESRNGAMCERLAATMFRRNGGNCRLCNATRTVCSEWQ